MTKTELTNAVFKNFPREMPHAVKRLLCQPRPHPENDALHRILRNKNWSELRAEVYLTGCPSIFVLCAEAFLYFLPGIIRAAIEYPDYDVASSLDFCVDPKNYDRKSCSLFLERFGSMPESQREVIAGYYDWLISQVTPHDDEWSPKHRLGLERVSAFWKLKSDDWTAALRTMKYWQ